MIDFDIPADLAALRDEIRAFVAERIVPYETDPRLTGHGPDDELRAELVELAPRRASTAPTTSSTAVSG